MLQRAGEAVPHTHSLSYLAHVEGEAEEDQVQSAPLNQHTGVLD